MAQGLESSREASCSPRARPEPDGTEANAAVAVAAWDASNEGVRLRRLKVAMMLALPITMGHCRVAYRLEGCASLPDPVCVFRGSVHFRRTRNFTRPVPLS